MPPRDVAMLVSEPATNAEGLPGYLHGLVTQGVQLVVMPFDPVTFTFLDLDGSARVQDRLGVVVGVPESAVGGPVPEDLADRLAPVDATGRIERTGRPPAAYRLLPAGLVTDRRQLAGLATEPPSVARLIRHLPPGGSRTAGDGARTGDLSALAGVYYAIFGDLPGLSLAGLLASAGPLSRPGLHAALGAAPKPMSFRTVLGEFESGLAAAALVHPPHGAPVADSFWLVRDGAGALWWATGNQRLEPVVLDGAVDRRTAVLEHPHNEIVLIGPDGVPYEPELAVRETWAPRAEVTDRTGELILLGPEGRSPALGELMAGLEQHNRPTIVVSVRRGAALEGRSRLDPLIAESLRFALAKHPEIAVVAATERNDELEFLVADQYGRSSVQPATVGLGRGWDVQGGRSVHRELYRTLTGGALTRAAAFADPPGPGPSELVGGLLKQLTWKDVAAFLDEFRTGLRRPEVVRELADLQAADRANGERLDRFGKGRIKDDPFYQRDRILGGIKGVIEQEQRAAADPTLAGKAPLEPQHPWPTEPIRRHTQTADSGLFIGYLTGRPLDATRLGREVGRRETTLLWARELVETGSSGDLTKASMTRVAAVMGAKGELEGERAARRPGEPETYRAYGGIAEIIADVTDRGETVDDMRDRIRAADCLTGQDRVAWHYILRDVVKRAYAAHWPTFEKLQRHLLTCFDRSSA
ncbi:hypothetical protein [Micromonospora sp. KLBMP9576]|uniref:hypothetical protein n=1 Tax=Micromonospora sp. KLBMP9576 TaxID=3424769 RepID=UPI003D8AE002